MGCIRQGRVDGISRRPSRQGGLQAVGHQGSKGSKGRALAGWAISALPGAD